MELREQEMKKEMTRLRAMVDSRPTAGASAARPTAGASAAATATASSEEDDDGCNEPSHEVEVDDHPPFQTVAGIKRFLARSNQDQVKKNWNPGCSDITSTICLDFLTHLHLRVIYWLSTNLMEFFNPSLTSYLDGPYYFVEVY